MLFKFGLFTLMPAKTKLSKKFHSHGKITD